MHSFRGLLMLGTLAVILVGCEDSSSAPTDLTPGWQQPEDMYNPDDYTWDTIVSPTQLVGNWIGSRTIAKPAVAMVNPEYELMVILKFLHVDTVSTLYKFTEDHYFNDAVQTEEDWERMKEILAGQSTGGFVNLTYPGFVATSDQFFWGTAAATPGATMIQNISTPHSSLLPEFVESLSMKISEDGTKLLIHYSDTIQFVIGKQ